MTAARLATQAPRLWRESRAGGIGDSPEAGTRGAPETRESPGAARGAGDRDAHSLAAH